MVDLDWKVQDKGLHPTTAAGVITQKILHGSSGRDGDLEAKHSPTVREIHSKAQSSYYLTTS